MSVRSRGVGGSAVRTRRVLSRFGPTEGAMSAHLDHYAAIAAEQRAPVTWPTTACVLARHPGRLRAYTERGIELAVHGLVHADHERLDARTQRDSIARALDIFARAGVKATGFRGPYLRYNAATLDVLRSLGFRYHSSQAIVFPPRDARAAAARAIPSFAQAIALYHARDARDVASLPRIQNGIVDIPVAIPDDEIIVERLRFDGPARADEWRHILELTQARGELFTLQLHPERIPELGTALATVLAHARRRGVWIASLDAIAQWWQRRSRFSVHVTRSEDGYCARLVGDDDARLVVRDGALATIVRDGQGVPFPNGRRPVASVSTRTPAAVRRFLEEDGVPVEISDDANAYGAHIDRPGGWTETGVLEELERAPGPLVRIARWPDAAPSALAITGDIDAITLKDFVLRSWETRARHVTQGAQT